MLMPSASENDFWVIPKKRRNATHAATMVSMKRPPSLKSRLATVCVYPEVPIRVRDLFANLPTNQRLAKISIHFALENWQQVEHALLVQYGIGPHTVGRFRRVFAEWFPESNLTG